MAYLRSGITAREVCPDGARPLLKPVAAGPGDEVVLDSAGIMVNGRLLPNTAPMRRDSEGRPLAHWAYGHFKVSTEMLWVASTYNSRSYDSRYLGPILKSAIRARLQSVVAW